MLRYEDLKNKPKELLAATSLRRDEFEALLGGVGQRNEARYPAGQTMDGRPRQRRKGGGNKGPLTAMADKLLFILVYEKTYPLQTMLGLQFGLSQGRVNCQERNEMGSGTILVKWVQAPTSNTRRRSRSKL